jgi:drug/metabolite transporter (DMT)-like permease
MHLRSGAAKDGLVGIIIILTVIAWVLVSESIQALQVGWTKPFYCVYVLRGGFVASLIPWYILRGRRTGNWRLGSAAPDAKVTTVTAVPVRQQVWSALALQSLVGVGAYCWYLSLAGTSVTANNSISQSTPALVYVMSLLMLEGETGTPRKVSAVVICVLGVVIVAVGSVSAAGSGTTSVVQETVAGYIWLIISVVLYA